MISTQNRKSPELIIAPMKGFTDTVFRNVYSSFFKGIDRAVGPFISPWKGGKIKPAQLSELSPSLNTAIPVVPQILANIVEDFLSAARILMDMGYTTLNLNLGCPFPAVVKKGRGAGALPYPEIIDAFLDRILTELPVKLSVKTRLGRYSEAEFIPLLPVFNRYPLTEIIIHPRTAVQRYEGKVNLEAFENFYRELRHPVVYNGDIQNADSFDALFNRFPDVDGWMLGRGTLINPFLPEMIKTGLKRPSDPTRHFHLFHDALVESYAARYNGPHHLLNRMKGFWKYFSKGFEDSRQVAKMFHKINSFERYSETAFRFFNQEAKWSEEGSEKNWVNDFRHP